MNKKTIWIILFLLTMCAFIILIPLMTIKNSEFSGTDGKAEEAVKTVDPDYEPWMETLVELPGGETETLLFCIQTAVGAIIIGYGFGYFAARKKFGKDSDS